MSKRANRLSTMSRLRDAAQGIETQKHPRQFDKCSYYKKKYKPKDAIN